MKLVNKDVIDLSVFTDKEELVVQLNSLTDAKIEYDQCREQYFIGVNDATFNLKLHKFLHKEEKLTDFQLATRNNKTTLCVGKPNQIKCKLVGKTYFRECENHNDKEVSFEVHNAEVLTNVTLQFSNYDLSTYDYLFYINLDENNNFFKMHINN